MQASRLLTHAATEAVSDDSTSGVEVVRYATSDPYALSLTVAQALVDASGGTSEWVVLASGESWADAATAGPLAASLGAPVLLVPPAGLQAPAARPDLVEFLRSISARRVVIVGSPDVLPNHEPSVLFGLGMLPRNIERVHGDDSVGASVAVAKRINAPTELGELGRAVIIAGDQSVVDAVAVGPLAAAAPLPLLLTAPDALDPRVSAYLTEHDIEHVVLVGGTAAIAPTVQEVIEAAGATVTRLAGRDRRDTARLAADLFKQHTADDSACEGSPIRIGLVPAQYPDRALTVGPLLAAQCTSLDYVQPDRFPLRLQNTLYLAQHDPVGARVVAFADDQVLPDNSLRPSAPPVRIAAWQLVDVPISGQPEVVLVVFDERGNQTSVPSTRMALPSHRTRRFSTEGVSWFDWGDRLTWAPDGRRVAYSHTADNGLRVLDTETREELQVRYGSSGLQPYYSTYDWSHDGRQLLFSAELADESTVSDSWTSVVGRREYSPELFLYSDSDQSLSRLTRNDWSEFALKWSPDGRRFTYYSTPSPDGLGAPPARLATLEVYDVASGNSYSIDSSFGSLAGIHAHWSHDGARIAFGATTNDKPSAWFQAELFIADHDGANLQQLTPANCPECFADRVERQEDSFFEPFVTFPVSWSPSDERIAYYSDASLQLYDFDTEKGHVLLPYGFSRFGVPEALRSEVAGWSSDGQIPYVQPAGADCRVVAFDIQVRPRKLRHSDLLTLLGTIHGVDSRPPSHRTAHISRSSILRQGCACSEPRKANGRRS